MKKLRDILKEDVAATAPVVIAPAQTSRPAYYGKASVKKNPQQVDQIKDLLDRLNKRHDPIGDFLEKQDDDKRFKSFIKRTFDYEGGHTVDTGGETQYGISQKYNPDVNVKNITKKQAIDIYREKHYKPLMKHMSDFSEKSRAIILDASVNQGPNFAKHLIDNVGNNPEKLVNARQAKYDDLKNKNPAKYGQYHQGWTNRLKRLQNDIKDLPHK